MAKQEVMKKIKELISSPGWEEIEKVLKNRRDEFVVKSFIIQGLNPKSSLKQISEDTISDLLTES